MVKYLWEGCNMMGRQSGQMSMLVLDFTELIPDHHLLRKISQAISFDFIYISNAAKLRKSCETCIFQLFLLPKIRGECPEWFEKSP